MDAPCPPGSPSALLIDSPTGVPVRLVIAGPGARVCAFLLDWLARVTLALGWYAAGAFLYHGHWTLDPPLGLSPAWFAGVLLPAAGLYLLYRPVLEIALHGRTPGMRACGVRLLSREGTAPDLSALLIRNVFRLVDSLPLCYGVGLVMTLCTREQVRLGDLAAGTVLVYEPPSGEPRGHRRTLEEALALTAEYQQTAQALARARMKGPAGWLEARYASLHTRLHRGARHLLPALVHLLREEIPAVTARLRLHILWAGGLFALMVGAGYLLVQTHPALIRLFASPQLIASVERGQLWTAGLLTVVPSSILSLQILTNNIVVSLTAYCAGVFLGLGTLYILGVNGLSLGAVLAFTHQHGLALELLRFVVPHGCVELSVLCLAAAAGAAVGEAWVHPTERSRLQSFRKAARSSGKLLGVCAGLLMGCGVLEGYFSADPAFPGWSRLLVGVAYWLGMAALLTGRLWPRRRGAESRAWA